MGIRKKYRKASRETVEKTGILLIDAYNTIHAEPALRDALAVSLELARNRLRDMCRFYLQRHGTVKIILIFDGDSSVGSVIEMSREKILSEKMGISEIFTPTGVKADNRIILEVRQRASSSMITVVTADIDVIQECRVAGAYVIAPDVFIQQSRPKEPRPRKKHRVKNTDSMTSPSDKYINHKQQADLLDEFESMFGNEMDKPL